MLGKIVRIAAVLGLAIISVSVANEYAAANHYQEGLRVDEKDYAVDGGHSSYWLLCLPVIMIPLILLLCTPVFHKPYDVPYHHGGHHGHDHHGHAGHGWGWGTYNLGWGRNGDVDKEELTGRVLNSITKK